MKLLSACVAALLIAVWVPATAAADPGSLSPRLAELATPAVRALTPAQQAHRLDVPASGPASLMRQGSRVVAEVRFDQGAAAGAESLRAAGADVLDVSRRYQTVTVAAAPADLQAVAAVNGVAGVTEVLAPIVRGVDCGGAVRSEGEYQLGTDKARESFAVDGTGVTVGIVSDSFDRRASAATHAADDVVSGDLPGPGSPCGSQQPVGILSDSLSSGTDEGRAMAQIVHDLAPGAAIDFATAAGGQNAFAKSIRALAGAGAQVIADDAIYLDEPFFQDGPVAVAINEVTAAGASYFTAAGNDNVIANGSDVGSVEAQFEPVACPLGVPGAACANFSPGGPPDNAFEYTVEAGKEIVLDLQWAEPWGGVQDNFDLYLVDAGGAVLNSSIYQNVSATQRPFEALGWRNEGATTTVKVGITRTSGTGTPRFKLVQVGNGGTGVFPTPTQLSKSAGLPIGPTVIGHSGAVGAISTGAILYSTAVKPQVYSSRGPVVHLFGPVNGVSPAAPTGEVVISKPDLVATDCGLSTFFAFKSGNAWRFCGTSAAAPHAAAVAALMRQANPGAGQAQVRAALLASGRPVGAFGPTAVGAGLPDAFAAVNAVALAPSVTVTRWPPALSRERRPTIEFTASRPVAFGCILDGGSPISCSSPFRVPSNLADGKHSFQLTGVDAGGRAASSPVLSFRIDNKAPQTKIAKHPPKLVRTRQRRARVVFRFRASDGSAKFVCKVDRGRRRLCTKRLVVKLEPGEHEVQAKAVDAAGNVDPTPAVFRFAVKRVG